MPPRIVAYENDQIRIFQDELVSIFGQTKLSHRDRIFVVDNIAFLLDSLASEDSISELFRERLITAKNMLDDFLQQIKRSHPREEIDNKLYHMVRTLGNFRHVGSAARGCLRLAELIEQSQENIPLGWTALGKEKIKNTVKISAALGAGIYVVSKIDEPGEVAGLVAILGSSYFLYRIYNWSQRRTAPGNIGIYFEVGKNAGGIRGARNAIIDDDGEVMGDYRGRLLYNLDNDNGYYSLQGGKEVLLANKNKMYAYDIDEGLVPVSKDWWGNYILPSGKKRAFSPLETFD